MTTRVVLHPDVYNDLDELFVYLADRAGRRVATQFLDRILARCRSLETFPLRGAPRPSLGKDIRLLGMERRVTILYRAEREVVVIIGVFYGGQDIAERLSER